MADIWSSARMNPAGNEQIVTSRLQPLDLQAEMQSRPGSSIRISFDCLIQPFGRHAIHLCKIGIQYDPLASNDGDEAFYGLMRDHGCLYFHVGERRFIRSGPRIAFDCWMDLTKSCRSKTLSYFSILISLVSDTVADGGKWNLLFHRDIPSLDRQAQIRSHFAADGFAVGQCPAGVTLVGGVSGIAEIHRVVGQGLQGRPERGPEWFHR